MNFLEHIFQSLNRSAERPVLGEARPGGVVAVSGRELLELVRRARAFIRRTGLRKGERCALLAHNSIHWAAADVALMAEGIVVVPLYARQAPAELVAIMRDAAPRLILCGGTSLRDAVAEHWADAPPRYLLSEVMAEDGRDSNVEDAPTALGDGDSVTIIYTSGTSGDAKGAVLTVGNLNHMLACTTGRLDQLMGQQPEPERVFHYLPFCFAGSWILLLSCLSRRSLLTLSTDLTKLMDELAAAAPQYFLNVPVLLERVRKGVEEKVAERGGVGRLLFEKGKAAWLRQRAGQVNFLDSFWLTLARRLMFAKIRGRLGPNLKALICGSAPLALETQQFFVLLGLPVLQVYGLTETTAICTMDVPGQVEPGRVGPAIPWAEMKLGENDEILVRGPHIFPGYWNRPEETAKVLRGGWFHTGDQGEVNAEGNWRIIGRVKNLIILSSGHNIAPEPMEDLLVRSIPGAQQVVLVGNSRSYLAALLTGNVEERAVAGALAEVNGQLPHYKQVRAHRTIPEPFSIENGLLTANGKLKRDAIAERYGAEIESLYSKSGV